MLDVGDRRKQEQIHGASMVYRPEMLNCLRRECDDVSPGDSRCSKPGVSGKARPFRLHPESLFGGGGEYGLSLVLDNKVPPLQSQTISNKQLTKRKGWQWPRR
jgi:hypothetical protein